MQILYFTPASIGFLTQLILSLAITLYLFHRCLRNRKNPNMQTVLLTGVFAGSTLFVGMLLLDATVLPAPRLAIVYLENTVLSVVVVLLFQFAYRFPTTFPQRRWEARVVLALSLFYLSYEALFAIYRFWLLLGQGQVEYRYTEADYALTVVLVWVPLAFLRQAISADARPVHWVRKLWKPQGLGARGARSFAGVVILLLGLNVMSMLADSTSIPIAIFNAILSLGILIAIWLFVTVYLNFVPENTSFLIKLSGVMLTLLLAVLGLVGWAVSPAYAAAFRPALTDHQTLRFTPTSTGGYEVTPQPFTFETELGDRLPVTSRSGNEGRNHPITFTFPFQGKTYATIYATSVGALSLGQKLYHPNLQFDYTSFANIFPLLIDLKPESGGGVFARVEPDRLVVTWDHLSALDEPNAIYTFQAVLYQDGRFDFTYNGLPDPLVSVSDAQPSASPWLRGVTSGRAGPVDLVENLAQSRQSQRSGIVQDFYQDFRQHLSDFIAPLAGLILGSSLLIIIGLPMLVNSNLIKPLSALLAGIERVESGDLTVEMPVQHRDEIGSLTASFNAMTAQLRLQVTELEQRVTERTQELQIAIARLKSEAREREAAEKQIIQQQLIVAVLEERERVARELHDGIGQILGYVNVQAQATQTLLVKDQIAAAQKNLEGLVQVVQDAHANLRHTILGLRDSVPPQRDLCPALQAYLESFSQAWGIKTSFSPPQHDLPVLPAAVEDQLLHIVQEALVNIRKHAQARRVEVFMTLRPGEMTLLISDDGQGFDPQLAPGVKEEHFGLSIMRERAEQVGGWLEIRSASGRGTQVLVYIPYLTTPATEDKPKDVYSLRLLLVDDQPLFLEGLRNLLKARGLTVIGMAHDGLEACEQVKALRPDVVLMDVHMPQCDGIEATRRIKAEFPEIHVVLLTVSEDDEHLVDAVKYGAASYILKTLDADRLFATLDGLARGEIQLAPEVAVRLLAEFNRTGTAVQLAADGPDAIPGELTLRQWEVLRLVARGLTYKEAGRELHVTEQAIKYHMAQVLDRLQVKNREQAVAYLRQVEARTQKRGPRPTSKPVVPTGL